MKNTTQKRLKIINEYLLTNNKATTTELAHLTNVTPEMIRRDLQYLEDNGLIVRIHGGAVSKQHLSILPFSARKNSNKAIKEAICKVAINYVYDGNIVFVDPSTTALSLANLLSLKKNLTIVSNCIEFSQIAAQSGHKTILLGGEYFKGAGRTIGFFCHSMIQKMYFDIAFFGADGCSDAKGPTTESIDEILINQEVIQRSKKNVLLVDSTKFSARSNYVYADYTDFDVLITNTINEDEKQLIRIKEIKTLE